MTRIAGTALVLGLLLGASVTVGQTIYVTDDPREAPAPPRPMAPTTRPTTRPHAAERPIAAPTQTNVVGELCGLLEGGRDILHAGPFKVEMVKAAYMGVSGVPVDPAMRKQLSLPEGVGLLVDYVDPQGPAKAAGVEVYDVLSRLNDQILINPQQLAVLVRIFKPQETVKLTLIRQAKEQTLEVKLVEKEVPKLDGMHSGLIYGLNDLAPTRGGVAIQPDRVAPGAPGGALAPWRNVPMPGESLPGGSRGGAMPGNPFRAPMPGGPGVNAPGGRPPGPPVPVVGPGGPPQGPPQMGPEERLIVAGMGAAVSMNDGVHSLTLTFKDGGKTLQVKDKDGKVLFDGPIDTPQQRQAVPKDVLDKLEKLEMSCRVRLEPNPPLPHDDR